MEINPQVQVYFNDTFNLARSMVVKSDLVAQAINAWVESNTGVQPDPQNPASWKYYLNLSGQYSPYDPMIQIYSLDTGEIMDFTPENLQNNPVTLENYYPGSFFFEALISQYPLQQDLILSIIYPVNIDTAINAEDGTILTYNPNYVEPNEYTLISDLNKWSIGFHVRWDVKAYAITDGYYPPAQRAVYYSSLVPKLVNLRALRAHTIEAHSFHVREYLSSHNNLSQYLPYLTLEQQLYLYRNINHYRRHSGFKKVLTDLIDLLATPNNILIAGFNLDKTNEIVNTLPVSQFYLDNLSGVESAAASDVFTLSATLDLEMDLDPNNAYYITNNINNLFNKTQYTTENQYLTKILYSNNLQIGNPFSFTLQQTIFNELLYISFENSPVYNAIALVQLLNGKYVYLSPSDAVYLLLYLGATINGITLEYLPTLYPIHILVYPFEPFPEFENFVDYNRFEWNNLNNIYNEVIALLPTNAPLNNIVEFYNYCNQIYQARVQMYFYVSTISNPNYRAFLENAFTSLFSDYSLPPRDSDVLYDIWLNDRYINLSTYQTNDLVNLFYQVYQSITNYDLTQEQNYSNTIESVISIIQTLCSYTLQFITDFTDKILSLDKKDLRYYDFISSYPDYAFIEVFNLEGLDVPLITSRLMTIFNAQYTYDSCVDINYTTSPNNLNVLSQSDLNYLATLSS